MHEPTHPSGTAAVLSRPSLSAQLLTAAADELTGTDPAEPLTVSGWGRALALAGATVLAGYPAPVADNAAARAIGVLRPNEWATARTRAAYAVHLLAAAREL